MLDDEEDSLTRKVARDEIRKLQERELEINMSTKIKVYNDDVKKELIGRSTQGKAGMIAKKKR